jgi:hypothetical protein
MCKAIRVALARRLKEHHGIDVGTRTQRSSRMVTEQDPDTPGKTRRVSKQFSWEEECVYWGLFSQGSGVAFDGDISQESILRHFIDTEDWTRLLQLRWCISHGLDIGAVIKHDDNHYTHENTMKITLNTEDVSLDPDELDGPELVDQVDTDALIECVETLVKARVVAGSLDCYKHLDDYYTRRLKNDGKRSVTVGNVTITVEPTQESEGHGGNHIDPFADVVEHYDDAYEVLFGEDRECAPYRLLVTLETVDEDGDTAEEELDLEELIDEGNYFTLHSEDSLEESINHVLKHAIEQRGPAITQPAEAMKKAA